MTMAVHSPVWKGEFNVTRQQGDILNAIPPLRISVALICKICSLELLERLFSLWERVDRVGERRRDRPLALWTPGPQNPRRPVLAVAAVVAVALGRAVALQQAALSIVRILHCILLPVCPVVVFYHTAKGGRAGLIWGSPFLVSTRAAGAAPMQRQGLGDIPSATASPGDLGRVP